MAGIPPELDLQGLLAEDRFLRSLARNLLGSDSDAEDAAQHTWLRSLEKPAQSSGNFRAFLSRILTRHTLNLRRETHRRDRRERRMARGEALPSAADMAAREELRRHVGEAILSLDEPYRTTIWLRFRDELPPREVARVMQVPVETVRTRTRRALDQLRGKLDSRYGHRRTWGTALLSLLSIPRRSVLGSGTATLLGGVIVNKTVVAAFSVLIGLALLVWWQTADAAVAEPPAEEERAEVTPLTENLKGEALEQAVDERRMAVADETGARPPVAGANRELLRGIVVNPDGEPIPGAVVELQHIAGLNLSTVLEPALMDPESVAHTRTGSDGTFSFDVPRVRSFTVEARAAGYAPGLALSCAAGQYRTITVDEGATIEGYVTVIGDHRPAEGAEIRVYRQNGMSDNLMAVSLTVAARVFADGSGYYRASNLPAEEHRLQVFSADGTAGQEIIELHSGEARRLDFTVDSRGGVVGTVRDALTGQPVAGASVSKTFYFYTSVPTDDRGQFELLGSHGAVYVRADGYALQEAKVGGEPGSLRSVDVELIRGGAVQGRLLDVAGDAVSGVYVAAVASRTPGKNPQPEWRSARSGPDGRFRIEDLNPRLLHDLFIRDPDFGLSVYAFPKRALAGESIDFGDVTLPAASGIRGRIVDAAGNGQQSMVFLQGTNEDRLRYVQPDAEKALGIEPLELTGRRMATDFNGEFQLESLSPGTYRLAGFTLDMHTFERSVTIEEGGHNIEGLVLSVAGELTVAGEVRIPSGVPPEELEVLLVPEAEGEATKMHVLKDGVTSFEFTGIEPGQYRVEAQVSGAEADRDYPWFYGQRDGVEAGTTDVQVLLKPVEWVEGTVRDGRGDPVGGITVYAAGKGEAAAMPSKRVRTGEDGRFRLKVGQGDVVDVHAGPPRKSDRPSSSNSIRSPDPERKVIASGVLAGTRDLVIHLR